MNKTEQTQTAQTQGEQIASDAKNPMYQRGERDGLAGLNPSSTSADYMKGYGEGRRTRIERNLRAG